MKANFLIQKLIGALTLFLFFIPAAVSAPAQSSRTSGFNPDTVMMSRFTFTRPEDWKWVETRQDVSNVIQSVTFHIHPDGTPDHCRAYFNHFHRGHPAGSRKAALSRWKESFIDTPASVTFDKPIKIGTNSVAYVEMSGSYRVENSKTRIIRSGHGLYGAVIDDPEGNIVIRMMGPASAVEKAKPAFKKMIEDALRDE